MQNNIFRSFPFSRLNGGGAAKLGKTKLMCAQFSTRIISLAVKFLRGEVLAQRKFYTVKFSVK